jgi:hypothetical protein
VIDLVYTDAFVIERLREWSSRGVEKPLDTGREPHPTGPARSFIREFASGDRRLVASRPVEVTVTCEADCFIACAEGLHIWATGESPEAAKEDLVQQVVYFHDHYRRRPAESLVGLASRLKALYETSFMEAAAGT